MLFSFLVLFNFILPASAQSGFSNIGSFFNKNKHQQNQESNFDNALTIKEILIEGNRLISEESILDVINSKVGIKFDKDNVLKDLEAIDKLGYFVHDSIQANPEQTEEGILLKIRIEENNPISSVQIIGNSLVSTDELLLISQDLVGKPESLIKISEVLDRIEKKYQERGFILARVTDIGLDPDGTLTIKLNEGVIDKVVIKGNTKTKEKYIKRFLPDLLPNEPYNEILLVQDFRALQGTGLFEDIKRNLTPSKENPDKYDLNIELEEKRSSSFGFGGGVNTLNGVFANLGYSNSNLFGEGKQASFNTQFGTGILANTFVDQRFLADRKTIQVEAKYSDPNFLNTKNSVTLFTHGYTFNSYLVDLAQEKNIGLGASITRPLGMNLFGGLDLSGEAVQIKEFGSSATDFLTEQLVNIGGGKFINDFTEKGVFKPGQTFSEHEDAIKKAAAADTAKLIREEQLKGGKYLNFNPSLAFDTRDNPLNPRNGWNNKVNIGQGIGIGNDSFTKLGIDLRRYIPIGQKTTLAFNLQGASKLIGDLPMYNQFKAGGYYGVRGYRPFSDLGIGSRSLLASLEVRTPLLDTIPGIQKTPLGKDLRLVFFGDFGYVGGNNKINRLFNRLDTAASAGIGIRANIPMLGAIRIDYGIPFIKSLWNNKNILGRFNFGFSDRF
ncbi:MAG: hypothetical protein A3I68_05335 [Candidatus Melainabacteria bacterium RIFCSPLOWO2_02_FULL_35_15]|nr:MAG: hypothetical protein A3F80_07645 [Candidatus Melainabacteria bacterium RIFCSPLOWO2_12_FULL_35_11]OGI12870.1 MAG: hypothetical protein A3I68_05335 [Candidatus Melainabacteria bacterium RIFCSPLOWO2_02_FULL_35_15]